MVSLAVGWIIKNEKDFFGISFNSVVDFADKTIVVLDKDSNDGTREILQQLKHMGYLTEVYERKWDTGAQQKQYLLEKLRETGCGWLLFLDGDECLGDNGKQLLDVLEKNKDQHFFNIRSHHFIYSLCSEDATVPRHYHSQRLIKNLPEWKFTGVNHALLSYQGDKVQDISGGFIENVRIYHLGYVKHLARIMEKYKEDIEIQQIHSPDFLRAWKNSHVLGGYPVNSVNPLDIPNLILEYFNVDKDMIYFADRMQIEAKHWQDAVDWFNFMVLSNGTDYPSPAFLLLGCGAGHRLKAFRELHGEAYGLEKSQWVIDNTPHQGIKQFIKQGDITEPFRYEDREFNFVVAYDVLEHIDYADLQPVLKEMYRVTEQYILISVPFKGDPNLELDPTHIIKEDRIWWEARVKEAGFSILEVPEAFQFRHQLILAKKNEG